MKAIIDLNWLDTEIEQTKGKIKVFQEGHILQTVQIAILGKLEEVRLKCEPIEEIKRNKYPALKLDDGALTYDHDSPILLDFTTGGATQCLVLPEGERSKITWTAQTDSTTPFLSKTCINDWESNKYCANQNKCELCKIKQ